MKSNVKRVTTTFGRIHQPFRKVVRVDGAETVVLGGTFILKEKRQTLHIDTDKRTVVCTLDDGEVGQSKCMSADEFNETKGIKIAYIRAKIKSLEKELETLTR